MQDFHQYILHKTIHLQHKGTNLWKHTTLYNLNCILVWERCYINIFSLHLTNQSSHIASILCCHNIQSKITLLRSHCHNNEFTYTILTFFQLQKMSTSPFSSPFLPLMYSWKLSKKCYILPSPYLKTLPPTHDIHFAFSFNHWCIH